MPRPHEAVSALASSQGNTSPVNSFPCSGGDYFLSREFLAPYGDDFVHYFEPHRRPPMGPGDLRAAMLNAATYVDDALDAQCEADDAKLVNAVEVAIGFLTVALGQMRGSPPPSSVH
jgi:hypothetical protein